MNLKEILDRQEAIRAELKKVEDNPAAVEESDGDYVDTLVDEYDALEARRAPLAARAEKLNLIRVASKDESATEPGESRRMETPTQIYRNKRDPFDDMEAVRTNMLRGSEMRERAHDAIEWVARSQWVDFPHDHAERATQLATQSKGIARHILMTGSQDYYEAFRSYVNDPEGMGVAHRATTLGTGSLGYMLPFVLDPTIILSNTGSSNPYRRISRVEQTTSNTWNGVTSAGVNAAFVGEATAATDASPSVSQVQITPQKAHAWVFGSYESLEDADLGAQLPRLFADAKDRLEESVFATGAGTGVIPQGAVTAATTGNTAAATAYAVADVYTLQGRLGPRFRNSRRAAWLSNLFYLNKTRQFDTAGGSSFWANLGQGTPELLLGKPVYESSSMSSATASGSKVLLFGDFEQYIIVDRVGMSVLYNPMLTAASTANLPTGEAGWYAFWRVGAKASTSTALQALLIQ
ncbi:MAG TPA: phage major capsid protein [Jiangellaceae bacterium]|nr:phage major capsid protein [Jiangellaceae bacterium]